MKISEKIEQIRKEPEHIRLRYVWGSVAISMLFIVAIWIFSITLLFQSDKNANSDTSSTTNISEQLQSIKDQAPSINSITGQTNTATTKDDSQTKQNTDNTNTDASQPGDYSNLSITSLPK